MKDQALDDRLARHVVTSCRWFPLQDDPSLGWELACVDGRERAQVVGTPGGSTGEILLALGALESLTGEPLDEEAVGRLLGTYAEAHGGFYQHTDDHVLASLGRALGVEDALSVLRRPPEGLKAELLELLLRPEHVGCGHLRSVLQDPGAYGVRPGLVEAVLRGFYRLLWEGRGGLRWVSLHGEHGEEAVVHVHTCDPMDPRVQVPMVAPHGDGAQVFVHHPEAVSWVRRRIADLVADEVTGVDAEALYQRIETLGDQQLATTLSRLAPGLPEYDATFCGGGFQLQARRGG